ncbi:hypothetical protein RBA41_28905 [Massilia sp. CCM 9210]|uniref:hypothetical protein n=1 Tax=Massilia scottii TaxID=3057166 RepID=UPI002796AACA|nr:hypothetical protein [Massilia sp. CCM 9210]MDQ1817333.1 hypothetical protein [Massilia sp. CCM 9210]
MIQNSVSIHKTSGAQDDLVLLRLSIPTDGDIIVELYSENDRLATFAHVLREYKKRTDKSSCNFSFGTFDPTDAGGGVEFHLAKAGALSKLDIKFSNESEKGKTAPNKITAFVMPEPTEQFIIELDQLALFNTGTAIWKLQG